MQPQTIIGNRVFSLSLMSSRNPNANGEQPLFVQLSCRHQVQVTQLEFKAETLRFIQAIYFNGTQLTYSTLGDRAILSAPMPMEGEVRVGVISDTLKGIRRPLTGPLIGEDGSLWVQTGCNNDYLVRLHFIVL